MMAKGGEVERRSATIAIKDLQRDPVGKDIASSNIEDSPNHPRPDAKKPIAVGLHTETGKLHLLNGYHRVAAAEAAGQTHIDAEVVPTKGKIHRPGTYDETYMHAPAKWDAVKKVSK